MGFNNKKCSQEPQGFTGTNCSTINESIDIILLDNYTDFSSVSTPILMDNVKKEEKGTLVKLDGKEKVTNIHLIDPPITSPRITKYYSNKLSKTPYNIEPIISKTK
jgi:hypothetical protein